MPIGMPTVDQVRQIPPLLELTIPSEWQDINGHVNAQHYLTIYNLTGPAFMQLLGVNEARIQAEQHGYFDLEQHQWYLAEMHVGDRVTAHYRFVAQSAKRFQGVMFIVNATRNSLASALEFVATAADLRTRRSAPLQPDVAVRLRSVIAEHSQLGWSAPRCGAIAV